MYILSRASAAGCVATPRTAARSSWSSSWSSPPHRFDVSVEPEDVEDAEIWHDGVRRSSAPPTGTSSLATPARRRSVVACGSTNERRAAWEVLRERGQKL
jgi:hypothetical protein